MKSTGHLLRDAYQSMSEGIASIESYLPRVESEEMNYDLNRQLMDYQRMAQVCETELLRCGEPVRERIQLSDGSYTSNEDRFDGRCEGDASIAASIMDGIQHRLESVRAVSEHSSDAAVSSIAMEIMEEEENHMSWMKSYVD